LKEEEIMVPQGEWSMVSKQRVRKVPVSNDPKRLRNISSGEKNSEEKSLSMQQDSNKKNVYHIYGRQTSESMISINATL